MMKIKRKERVLLAVNVILVISVLFMGCLILFRGLKPSTPSMEGTRNTVAFFKQESISESEWVKELKRMHGQEVLLHMLNRKAVYEEAKERGIHISSDEVARKLKRDMKGYDSEEAYYHEMETQLGLLPQDVETEMNYRLTLEQIAISDIIITDEQIDRYLVENEDQFEARKQFQLSVIKVTSRMKSEDILNQLDAGADFTQMVSEHSIDLSSRDKGGRIGAVEWNDPFLPQEMLSAADSLQIDDIAGPFKWDDEYVIIQLTDIIVEEQEDMRLIRESIRKQLALNDAIPLIQLEDNLREKYEARMLVYIPST
ncbi:peptidylprolyl isomerase [Paenibacillus sp. FA6]|uniref:peptidylprolyl isomerase n=1 Tax=Paenibacillus sp. FA6 TaxID=3413029 RepID=UPI003F65E982